MKQGNRERQGGSTMLQQGNENQVQNIQRFNGSKGGEQLVLGKDGKYVDQNNLKNKRFQGKPTNFNGDEVVQAKDEQKLSLGDQVIQDYRSRNYAAIDDWNNAVFTYIKVHGLDSGFVRGKFLSAPLGHALKYFRDDKKTVLRMLGHAIQGVENKPGGADVAYEKLVKFIGDDDEKYNYFLNVDKNFQNRSGIGGIKQPNAGDAVESFIDDIKEKLEKLGATLDEREQKLFDEKIVKIRQYANLQNTGVIADDSKNAKLFSRSLSDLNRYIWKIKSLAGKKAFNIDNAINKFSEDVVESFEFESFGLPYGYAAACEVFFDGVVGKATRSAKMNDYGSHGADAWDFFHTASDSTTTRAYDILESWRGIKLANHLDVLKFIAEKDGDNAFEVNDNKQDLIDDLCDKGDFDRIEFDEKSGKAKLPKGFFINKLKEIGESLENGDIKEDEADIKRKCALAIAKIFGQEFKIEPIEIIMDPNSAHFFTEMIKKVVAPSFPFEHVTKTRIPMVQKVGPDGKPIMIPRMIPGVDKKSRPIMVPSMVQDKDKDGNNIFDENGEPVMVPELVEDTELIEDPRFVYGRQAIQEKRDTIKDIEAWYKKLWRLIASSMASITDFAETEADAAAAYLASPLVKVGIFIVVAGVVFATAGFSLGYFGPAVFASIIGAVTFCILIPIIVGLIMAISHVGLKNKKAKEQAQAKEQGKGVGYDLEKINEKKNAMSKQSTSPFTGKFTTIDGKTKGTVPIKKQEKSKEATIPLTGKFTSIDGKIAGTIKKEEKPKAQMSNKPKEIAPFQGPHYDLETGNQASAEASKRKDIDKKILQGQKEKLFQKLKPEENLANQQQSKYIQNQKGRGGIMLQQGNGNQIQNTNGVHTVFKGGQQINNNNSKEKKAAFAGNGIVIGSSQRKNQKEDKKKTDAELFREAWNKNGNSNKGDNIAEVIDQIPLHEQKNVRNDTNNKINKINVNNPKKLALHDGTSDVSDVISDNGSQKGLLSSQIYKKNIYNKKHDYGYDDNGDLESKAETYRQKISRKGTFMKDNRGQG